MHKVSVVMRNAGLWFAALALVACASWADGSHRSSWARNEFKRLHPCPSTGLPSGPCPGWIIDHINPLACGGADSPANMQWQSKAAAKAKDRWERKFC